MMQTQGIWPLVTVSIREHGFSMDHKEVIHQELGTVHPFACTILLSVFWKLKSSHHCYLEVREMPEFYGLAEGMCQFPTTIFNH